MSTSLQPTTHLAERVLQTVREQRDDFVWLLTALASVESPTDDEEGQRRVQAILRSELGDLGYRTDQITAESFADHLVARRVGAASQTASQLIVGHCDTVWPVGTISEMPVTQANGCIHGPGTFDMKSGLAQTIVALRTLQTLDLTPEVEPVLIVNTDEEVGSPTSRAPIAELAERAVRAIIMEPSYGPEGKIKTARKGVARFLIRAVGRSAHSGLEPAKGASAILALAQAVIELHALNDPQHGTTVNVGILQGGTRPNVVPAFARAHVDVRATSVKNSDLVARAIKNLVPSVPGVSFSVETCESAPPLERTERNVRLWETVCGLGATLGFKLEHTTAGGASDGNTTSAHAPTIDGMGAVGDGAHATHEHIEIDPSLDRAALLALLLMAPAEDGVVTAR